MTNRKFFHLRSIIAAPNSNHIATVIFPIAIIMITNHIYLLFVQEKEVDHETQQQKQTETTEIKEKM